MKISKLLAATAVSIAMGAGAAAAATVALVSGSTYSFNPADRYEYLHSIDSTTASPLSFTFNFSTSGSAVGAAVYLNTGTLGMQGGKLGWYDNSNSLITEGSITQSTIQLTTPFVPSSQQTLRVSWDSISTPGPLSVQVSAVPVPAAGFLLLGGLGALGAVSRRKKKATA